MLVLSGLGVNIAPLLAGAGILGLAIGFGAQTLVRDIITGVFLILTTRSASANTSRAATTRARWSRSACAR